MSGPARPILNVLLAWLIVGCSSTTPTPSTTVGTPAASLAAPASGAPTVPAPVGSAGSLPPSAVLPSSGPSSALPSPSEAAPASAALPTRRSVAWQQELDDVAPDGTRSLASSLRLFAMAFGPIPGIDTGPADGDIASGSIALRGVQAHETELTADQRAAIAAALATPSGAVTITVSPGGATSRTDGPGVHLASWVRAVPGPDVLKAVEDAASQFRIVIAGKIGGDIPGPIKVILGGTRKVFGWTKWDFNGPGGTYQGCEVHIEQKSTDKEPLVILNTLAHEMFHCFELAGYNSLATYSRAPSWVVEGAAEWVGNVVAAPDTEDHSAWTKYLVNTTTPLVARSYDAMGFYAHLEETGTSPWSVFRAMFKAVESVPAFVASTATSDTFLDSWGSGLLRDPSWGATWDTTGPGITSDAASPDAIEVADGAAIPINAAAYTSRLHRVSVSAELLQVTSNGHVRISDRRGVDTPVAGSTLFCVTPDGCRRCPDGTELPVPPAPLAETSMVAVTGGPSAAAGFLTGVSMEEACKKQRAVWVHIERPASRGLLAGRVLELISCDGPNGTWNGFMALGGIDAGGGFTVAFARLPLHFTIGGKGTQTARTTTSGKVPTAVPTLTVTASYALAITVDPAARRMSITGTGTGSTDLFSFTNALGPGASNLTIQPAPKGRCP